MADIKQYKYKDLVFTPVKRTLAFHKTNYHFIKSLQDNILKDGVLDEEKFWEFIHTEENITMILNRFLDGEKDKLNLDIETDEEYTELITLVTGVLNDFFTSYKPIILK